MPQLLFLTYFSTTTLFLPLLFVTFIIYFRASGTNTLLHNSQ